MTDVLIVARVAAEPGWRAVCLVVPLQAAGKDVTKVNVKVLHLVEWGITFDGRLWPIDEKGKPVPRGQLDGVHAPGGMSDEELMIECRNRLQATVDAMTRKPGDSSGVAPGGGESR